MTETEIEEGVFTLPEVIVDELLDCGLNPSKYTAEDDAIVAIIEAKKTTRKASDEPDAEPDRNKPKSRALHLGQGKPLVTVPSGDIQNRETAQALGEVLSDKADLFSRSGAVCEISEGRVAQIVGLDANACRTRFEAHCSFRRKNKQNGTNDYVLAPTSSLAMDACRSIVASRELHALLPPISVVAMSPVMIEGDDGQLHILDKRYNRECGGVAILRPFKIDQSVEALPAIERLVSLLGDFDFVSDGDRARAFAAFITPALKLGGLLASPTPLDIAEADESQAGKTFRQKLVRAIYAEQAALVCKKEGGVGSFDESIQQALFGGSPFVAFDNVRGLVSSQILEAAITAGGDPVSVRIPHHGSVSIDASRVSFQLTSNSASVTRDLANRSSIVRIRKQEHTYRFKSFEEGDLLDHIAANQTAYLSDVFALITEWHRQGKPQGEKMGHHDFREWHGVMQWFADFAGLGDLLEGHEGVQDTASNPAAAWLRVIALEVEKKGMIGQSFPAADIADIGEDIGQDVPKYRGGDKKVRDQAAGRALAQAFDGKSEISIDGIKVMRANITEYNEVEQRSRKGWRYEFATIVEN